MYTISITTFPKYISWSIRCDGELYASGSDPLTSTNGDYMALLSNVTNHALGFCDSDVEILFNRG